VVLLQTLSEPVYAGTVPLALIPNPSGCLDRPVEPCGATIALQGPPVRSDTPKMQRAHLSPPNNPRMGPTNANWCRKIPVLCSPLDPSTAPYPSSEDTGYVEFVHPLFNTIGALITDQGWPVCYYTHNPFQVI
jgi:hypothetical protein